MSQTITLTIDGMHCDACVRRVTAALDKVAGAGHAVVEIGKAVVRVDGGTAPRELVDAVEKLGFTARVA
jgi:copper chaperone CopZ